MTMQFLKITVFVLFSCLSCWFALDFTLTSLGLGPWTLNTFITGTKHEVYHHELKANLHNQARFGNVFYKICTNEYGFKIACADAGKPSSKEYDIAFIGDSFTEAVGMHYEDSFVGLFAAQKPQFSVVNLGCSSYSPSIYFKKIEFLLKQGFIFKHLVVAIDISDIQDEAIYYALSEDGKVVDKYNTTVTKPSVNIDTKDSSERGVKQDAQQTTTSNTQNNEQFFIKKYFEYTWYANLIMHAIFTPQLGLKQFEAPSNRASWTHSNDVGNDYGIGGIEGGKAQAEESMVKLKNLLDTHNIDMSVLVYPWPTQLISAPRNHDGVTLWKNFCKKVHCKNFINANDIFFDAVESTSLEHTINEYYIRGDFHFNKNGNALINSVLQEYIR